MKRNRWLVIDQGLCRGVLLDDAAASRERVRLVQAHQRQAELAQAQGQNARRMLSRAEPHALLVSSDGEPVYPHDAAGFDARLAPEEAQFQDEALTAFVPALRGKEGVSIWDDPYGFFCSCTRECEPARAALTQRSIKSRLREVSRIPARAKQRILLLHEKHALRREARALRRKDRASRFEGEGGARGQAKQKQARQARAAEKRGRRRRPSLGRSALLYVATALVTFCLLALSRNAGHRLRLVLGLAPQGESDALFPDAVRSGEGKTRLKSLAPESLRAFDEVIEAKLKRDPAAYARALLHVDASRSSFPPQSIPSRAFIAAMAMYTMSDDDLDAQPRWRSFLEKLGSERTQGIGVVGYEASRVRKNLVRLVDSLQARGSPQAKALGLGVWWGAEQGGASGSSKGAAGAIDDALDGLARIERVFPSVPDNERVFRNLLTAHAIADAVQIAWIEPTQTDKARKKLEDRLVRLGEFADQVPRPERDLLSYVIEERRKRVGASGFDAKAIAQARVDFLLRLQEEDKGLCAGRENALLGDFLLQTLRAIHAASVAPKPVSAWSQCFISAKPFYAVERSSFDGPQETAMLSYLPHAGPLAQNVRAHERAFRGANPFAKLFEQGATQEASWHALAFLSGFTSQKAPWSAQAFNDKCKKKGMEPALCAQISFRLVDEAADKLAILSKFQEDYQPLELAHLAFTVAVDVYTGKTRVNGKRTPEAGAYQKLGFSQFFGQTYPEWAALEWQIKNF